jgi:CD109 antigen
MAAAHQLTSLFGRLVDDFEREIRFDVTVIESLTERKQNTSSVLIMHKYKYKMELIKTSDSFKPGLKYTAFVSILRPTHKT